MSVTIEVHVHRDFWSEAARQAAAESRKRKAHARVGVAAAASAYGRKNGAEQLRKAAAAHAELHGEEHGETFSKAAAAHTKRIAASHARMKSAAGRGYRAGRGLVRSILRANEETKLY